MIIDSQTLLWNATALSSDAASSNTYDTGSAGNDISLPDDLIAVIQVDSAADHTTGNETFTFQVIESANADLSSPTVLASRTILYSALTLGSIHYIPVPRGIKAARYLGLYFDGGGTTPDITVTAWFANSDTIQSYKSFADAIEIS